MASHRPSASITLPRDFKFTYADGDEPQTPAPFSDPADPSTIEPPPIPKQTFKLRRRPRDQPDSGAMDDEPILPTVEMTSPPEPSFYSYRHDSSPGYLAPRARHVRLLSPPKTPASQVTPYTIETADVAEWSMLDSFASHEEIERPLSAMSSFSDSSATSCDSSTGSYPSFEAGSCTSPESDFADPISFYEPKPGALGVTTPSSSFPTAKRVKRTRHAHFTPEMDQHLWITYMDYCQNPKATPFKMLPGISPPLGVCHRVAREAKATWRGHRLSHAAAIPRISIQRADSPDTYPMNDKHDDATPTASYSRASVPLQWPRSEAATRRRLRELSKRKPSLSAHYMRLFRTRSPSPDSSSSQSSSPNHQAAPVPESPAAESSSFSNRSLQVSLVEATAPSMQPDGPLAQLHNRTPQPPTVSHQRRGSDWYARIGRSGARAAHQKSQSLQLGLGLGSASGMQSNTFQRGSVLASPFDDGDSSRQNFLQSMNKTQSLGRAFFNNNPRVPDDGSLRSPFPLDGPMPSVRSLKRRFGVEGEPSQPSLEDVFTAPHASANHPMRNRGFSLSAMNHNMTNNFNPMFSPASSTVDPQPAETSDRLNLPKLAQPPRLGSPFGGASSSRFNTFPRRFTPREAELPEQPFEERIRQLADPSQPDS